MKKHIYINIGMAFIFSLLYVCFADLYSFPWIDEIYFSAPAYNFITGNGWNTAGIANPYPPLYSLLLGCWFFVFGFSHTGAVSFEIFLAFVSYCVLLGIINKWRWFNKPISYYLFLVLYWLGFYMPTIFTMGRVDLLVMLLVIVLIDSIIPINDTLEINKLKVLVASSLLPFTAIYPLPFIVFVFVYYYLIDRKNRKQYRIAGLYTLYGFIIGFVATTIFIYSFDNSLWVFHRMFAMAASGKVSFVEKLFKAYHDIPSVVLLIVTAILIYHKKSAFTDKKHLAFIIAIPALMLLAGRYERYYWWMMYIPTIIVFAKSIESYSQRVSVSVLSTVALICFATQLYFMQYPSRYESDFFDMDFSHKRGAYIEKQALAKKIVENNSVHLNELKNGVFSSALFYYTIAKTGNNCWYFNNAKFPDSLNQIFSEHDRTKLYWRLYEDFLRPKKEEVFPLTGIFYAIDKAAYNNCIGFFKREDIYYEEYGDIVNAEAGVLVFGKVKQCR